MSILSLISTQLAECGSIPAQFQRGTNPTSSTLIRAFLLSTRSRVRTALINWLSERFSPLRGTHSLGSQH